jgi:hypothetical protein
MKTYIGYKPYAHQKAIHDYITQVGPRAGKVICVKAKRQVGKSLLIEQELLRHAINNRRSVNICLSITFANCKKIFMELVQSIKNSGVIASINSQSMELFLVNGSTILFKSALQGEQLRGYTIKNGGILCIDEAAYIKDDVFSIIAPWTNVYNANILMVSTPRLKQGFFYNYFNEGLTGKSNKVYSFDLNDFDTSFLISQDTLDTYKKIMPPSQFMSEYMGMFIDDLGGVFDIKKDIWIRSTSNLSNLHNIENNEYDELFIGIDWCAGTGGDYTVITAFDAQGHQHFLKYNNNYGPTKQIDWITNIVLNVLQTKKIKKIVCESNSIGNIYIDMLKKNLPNIPIEVFTTTNESKRDIIEYLIARIANEKIKLFDVEEQYRQFSMYEVEITPSGKITYNGAAGTHDDIVMATAFAFKAIHDLEKNANYNIGWRKDKNRKQSLHERYN